MKYKIEFKHNSKDFSDVCNIERDYWEPSTIASAEQTIMWDKKNSDIHIFVRNLEENRIVGEITILPLSENQFKKFMINELEDTEINENTLLNYESGNTYYLLFSAIAIDKYFRNDRAILSNLLKGLYEKLKDLEKRKIGILNMCAEGQTIDGQKFIKSFLNLEYKYTTKRGFKLYSFNNSEEYKKWIEVLPKYIANYDEKYNIKASDT